MIRHRLLVGTFLTGLLAIAGCAPDLHDALYSQLATAEQAKPVLSDYQRGKQYLVLGQYGLAIQSFAAELQSDPVSVPALNGMAIAYERLGRTEVAEQFFNRALSLDPNSSVTLNNMAMQRMAHGDPAGAAVLVERAKAALTPSANEETQGLVASVLHNNEAALHQLDAANAAPAKAPGTDSAPLLQRVSDKEWRLQSGHAAAAVAPEPSSSQQESALTTAANDQTRPTPAPVPHNDETALRQPDTASPAPAKAPETDSTPLLQRVSDKPSVLDDRQPAAAAAVAPEPAAAPPEAAPVPPSVEQARLDVVNASGRRWMAHHIGQYLTDQGIAVAKLLNAERFGRARSVLFYQRNAQQSAQALARLLPSGVVLIAVRHAGSKMQLIAGRDLDGLDEKIAGAAGRGERLAKR